MNIANRFRILHFTQALGGVETAIRTIVENSNIEKFEHIVASPKKFKAKDRLTQKEIPCRKVIAGRAINPLIDLITLLNLILLLIRLKPHLLHCHSSKAGFIGRVAGRTLGIKTAFTPQAFSFFSSSSIIKRNIFMSLERIAAGFTDRFIACSESELKCGIESIGLNRERSVLWKNCLNQEIFHDLQDLPGFIQKPYICTIGRPSYQKHIELIILAIDKLRKNGLSTKCYFLGVGHYSPDRKRVRGLIRELDLSEQCILCDWSSHRETLQIVAQSELFVLTSRYEGLPFSIIEAMALSRAVVATDVPGSRDIVLHGTTGYLCPEESSAIAEKMEILLRDQKLRHDFGHKGREEYLRNYDASKMIDRLHTYYLDVIKGG